jgi:SAM-dependent methyltransferase/uncharacterized protein YbaR (Trm112 family)
MLKEAFDQIELFCPRCRRPGPDHIIQSELEMGDILAWDGDFILEGFLICTNPQCRFRYPILNGVPIIVKDLKGWVESSQSSLTNITGNYSGMQIWLADLVKSGAQARTEQAVSSAYLDFHYGDMEDAPAPIRSIADPASYWQTMNDMAQPSRSDHNMLAIDIGCSVGRFTFDLARLYSLAIGIDTNFAPVSLAACFQRNKQVVYERKIHGNVYKEYAKAYVPPRNVLFMVADALDPPFRAQYFDFVAALNVLDSIRIPLMLIGQIDALLKPGGELLLSSPYEWNADICNPSEWLESDESDGPAMVRLIFEGKMFKEMGLRFSVLQEQMDVPWILRNHRRYWNLFFVHLLKLRKY